MLNIPIQPPPVILKAMQDFLDMVKRSRSHNTALSYAKGISFFAQVLGRHDISVEKTTTDQLTEDAILVKIGASWVAETITATAVFLDYKVLNATTIFLGYS